jgi:ABC-type branched-subunit amino acid transport system ATPase component
VIIHPPRIHFRECRAYAFRISCETRSFILSYTLSVISAKSGQSLSLVLYRRPRALAVAVPGDMEHEKPSGGPPDSQTSSEQPEAQLPLPKLLAQDGGDFPAQSLDSSATIKTPATSNVDLGKKTERTIVIPKRTVSSLSPTDKKGASDDCELGSKLECLGSNVVGIPLPDVNDPAFDVREWAIQVLQAADADKVNFRKASFVFKGLDVSGSATGATVQPTVASMFAAPLALAKRLGGSKPPQKKILNSFDGVVNSGEMLLVLGRPGSGCSTLLRTIAGELGGIKVDTNSTINYNGMMCSLAAKFRTNKHVGIPQSEMVKHFAGELVYNADVDKHFPHLTVGETLQFAAAMRARQDRLIGSSRAENIERLTAVVMAVCGLTHTKNTKVGNDFVRGVSGGERKVRAIINCLYKF